METLYRYMAVVTSVYDGDTVTVDIDLGLGTFIKGERVRLCRIDAPEVRGSERPAGLKSRDFLRGMILGKRVHLVTLKDGKGKYGRYLGEIYLPVGDKFVNVNDLLVEGGFAVYHEY